MNTLWGWFKGLGVLISGAIGLFETCVTAQIIPDATLPNNSSIREQSRIGIIEGGTQAENNLFHSFKEFSVPGGTTAYFNNGLDIQNIITRVTGKSISNINGALKANASANIFLINPNGVIFGNSASLDIGGSFLVSTASSLNFADGSSFNATDSQTTLLTVSVPTGLQFGTTAAPILNQSPGLQLSSGKTLALAGGDVTLYGANIKVEGGRIELSSVAPRSLVSLKPTQEGWVLNYESVQNFQNIELKEQIDGSVIPTLLEVTGEGGGSIQLVGKRVLLNGTYVFADTLGSQPGGNSTVTASESLEVRRGVLSTSTYGAGNSGDLTINTPKLIVRDAGQLLTYSSGSGSGGNLTVNATDLVELDGGIPFNTDGFIASGLFSAAYGAGNAGDIKINTTRLLIQGGAKISTQSEGILLVPNKQFVAATGRGGNLTVNATESIKLVGTSASGSEVSSLLAGTQGSGNAGNLTLITKNLIVQDRATVTVGSQALPDVTYLGDARATGLSGDLKIRAISIILDNQGKLVSETDLGKGGNINLQVQEKLILRRNSQISTSAGKTQAIGDGGNITINIADGFIVTKERENSDITANAFAGTGGRIQINAISIFGMTPRSREELTKILGTNDPLQLDSQLLSTNDIIAISQTNPTLNGQVNINTVYTDPTRGLNQLRTQQSEPKLAQSCITQTGRNQDKFTIVGRQGIAPDPIQQLRSDNIYADWISLPTVDKNPVGNIYPNTQQQIPHKRAHSLIAPPTQIIEAQGWVIDTDGNVALVEKAPTPTSHNSFTQPDCHI
jgi:filamentous hemagglutinin family protein